MRQHSHTRSHARTFLLHFHNILPLHENVTKKSRGILFALSGRVQAGLAAANPKMNELLTRGVDDASHVHERERLKIYTAGELAPKRKTRGTVAAATGIQVMKGVPEMMQSVRTAAERL